LDRQALETFKLESAISVLGRLGDMMFATIKEELARYHGITLAVGSPFTLDELDSALQNLVGDGAAKWLMLEITAEIDYLSNDSFVVQSVLAKQ
jgi:hypothetical protein